MRRLPRKGGGLTGMTRWETSYMYYRYTWNYLVFNLLGTQYNLNFVVISEYWPEEDKIIVDIIKIILYTITRRGDNTDKV